MDSCFRNDAAWKVTGRAKYADDLCFSGMVHAVPVYSDFVHARILSVETGEAESMPGVLAVLTWKDIPGMVTSGQIRPDYPLLAKDRIRFSGEVIALVVADTRRQAVAAVDKVVLVAEELPVLLDPEDAARPDAPVIPEGETSNIICHHTLRKGDPDSSLSSSYLVVEERFETPFVEHAYMEPECGICVPRLGDVLDIYGSMQHPPFYL